MNWRHKLTLSFVPLLALFFLLKKDDKKTESDLIRPAVRRVASLPHSKIIRPKIDGPRRVRALDNKSLKHSILRNRIPQSLEAAFDKDPEIEVSRGHEFIKGVVAIAKNQYRSNMGDVVKQDEEFVFFRTSTPEKYIPVALAKSSNTLYPISSILHIKEATASVREDVLNKGFKQYYYHAQLKFLSVEAIQGQIMKSYNDLKRQGLQVELEVLKPTHRPN